MTLLFVTNRNTFFHTVNNITQFDLPFSVFSERIADQEPGMPTLINHFDRRKTLIIAAIGISIGAYRTRKIFQPDWNIKIVREIINDLQQRIIRSPVLCPRNSCINMIVIREIRIKRKLFIPSHPSEIYIKTLLSCLSGKIIYAMASSSVNTPPFSSVTGRQIQYQGLIPVVIPVAAGINAIFTISVRLYDIRIQLVSYGWGQIDVQAAWCTVVLK